MPVPPSMGGGTKGGKEMKRKTKLFFFLLAFAFLCGCGQKEKYDLQVEYNALVFADVTGYYLGQQYYQGEEILLAGTKEGEVRLLRDGKKEEILLRGVPESLLNIETRWWLDSQGNPYVLYRDKVFLLNQEGEVRLEAQADGVMTGICESAAGEIVLKINAMDKHRNGLAILDTKTGTLGKIIWLQDIAYCIAKGHEKDILIVDAKGLYDYGLSDGSRRYYIEWQGTSYDPQNGAEDIKFLSDNQIELYVGKDMAVTLAKINPEESGKTVLTYKTIYVTGKIKELIVQFNKDNPDYYIVIEERQANEDYDTFQEKVEIEIAAGHGPDIFDGSSVRNPYALIEKGAIEELSSYIEAAGIDREDYFPAAFQGFKVETGVYGIGIGMGVHSCCADSSVFSGEETFSLAHMMDILEEQEGDKVFQNKKDAATLVHDWLRPSEDLYGMVDWERNLCDFSGDNFRRILELAARYGAGEGKGADGYLFNSVNINHYGWYAGYDNSIKNSGRVLTGFPGEEAGVHSLDVSTLAINAASNKKEGAWQFICFLLQEEIQERLGTDAAYLQFPTNRQAFWNVGNYWCEHYVGVRLEPAEDPEWVIEADWFTEEQLADLESLFERAVFFPYKTQEILAIIEDETTLYFDGSKSMEETVDVIQNRVQLYLDEQAGR